MYVYLSNLAEYSSHCDVLDAWPVLSERKGKRRLSKLLDVLLGHSGPCTVCFLVVRVSEFQIISKVRDIDYLHVITIFEPHPTVCSWLFISSFGNLSGFSRIDR